MKKVLVLGKNQEPVRSCLAGLTGIQLSFSDGKELMPDTDCVLIAPDLSDNQRTGAVKQLSARGIPFAALSFDASEAYQELLLDTGIERIFQLPMSPALLQKRILMLADSSSSAGSDAEVDLFAQLTEPEQQTGAFSVQESEFSNIYRFVKRLQDRLDKHAQLVIFSFHSRLNTPPEPGTVEQAFRIVQRCLRRGDIACMYGQKVLAILMGTDAGGCRGAVERIVSTYEAFCRDSLFSMKYEMREIRNDSVSLPE